MVTQSDSLNPDPLAAAEQVIAAHKDEHAWLDAFSAHLDRHRAGHVLAQHFINLGFKSIRNSSVTRN